jgi:hypothetical protein
MDSLNNIEQSQIPLRKACDKLIIVTNSEWLSLGFHDRSLLHNLTFQE